ncbi:MAG: hypothetical protein II920_09760 [Clostridia bacterium]|nr:hypothetical protein [Clostridia bacterium]
MKRCLTLLLALSISLTLCTSLADSPAALSFAASNDISEIKALDGKQVTIIGYMATMSPVNGEFMYLMNLPYQSCPFCVPNTTQLANTMAVYASKGRSFDFTDQAVRVTGTLKVEDYTDEFGYEYNYRIVDASCSTVDLSKVDSRYSLWTTMASDGVTAEIYAMFDYLYFICQWQDYMFNYYDENGNFQSVPIYAGDVMNLLSEEGSDYLRMSADGYFDDLIARVRRVSDTELEDLVDILNKCKEVRTFALNELYGGAYVYREDTDSFTQNSYDELYEAWYEAYWLFSGEWINRWQL